MAIGKLAEPLVQVFLARTDDVGRAGLASDLALRVIDVNRYHASTVKRRRGDCPQPHAAAAEDRDSIAIRYASAFCSVEPDSQWFHQAKLFERKVGGVKFFGRNSDSLGQSSISLHAESLIEGARVSAATEATGESTTGGEGSQRPACS